MIILAILDYKMEKYDEALLQKMRLEAGQNSISLQETQKPKEKPKCFHPRDIYKFQFLFWVYNVSLMFTSEATQNST
jgi:hypothetical protein